MSKLIFTLLVGCSLWALSPAIAADKIGGGMVSKEDSEKVGGSISRESDKTGDRAGDSSRENRDADR